MNFLYKNKIRRFITIFGWLLVAGSFSFDASAQVTADFSASTVAGCPTLTVKFTDISTGNPTSWTWDFGNGTPPSNLQNPSTTYPTPGVYTVTLTASNGTSSNTKIKTNYILVNKAPIAGFRISNDTACIGQTITFTDTSVIAPGAPPIGTFAWNFGDGISSSVAVPTITHAYTTPGTYPISLRVTDPNNCYNNIIKNIVILPKPTLSFTTSATFACSPPLNVTFTNTSTAVGATTYSWNFGDGTTSAAVSPSHTYTISGTYNVTLIINQNGCIDSLVKPNKVIIQKIAANFIATPTVICTGDTIKFTNTSVPSAVTTSWNFGDGSTSTIPDPAHIYATAGAYTVTLISSDANGCKDTARKTVKVYQVPVGDFTADTTAACSAPLTVRFTNKSTGGTSYLWKFGDGSTSTATNPSHTYTTTGMFSVTLIATNDSGPCTNTIIKNPFIVISPPVAAFIQPPDSGCVPLTINFKSGSTSIIDPIATYTWNFGDGTTATTASTLISHTYTAAGVYSPSLAIKTVHGCSDNITCPNCIKAGVKPAANFNMVKDTVCYGLPVQFNDASTNATGWLWDFGDGANSTMKNPPHTYPDTGSYKVKLITYNNGCADTSLVKKVVIQPPKAIFSYTLSCTNYFTVKFASTSKGADSLVWNFGDGTIDASNVINPSHTYLSRGPKTVTLTAYNYATKCSNSFSQSFTIAEPIAGFTVISKGCYPFKADFTSTSQDAIAYSWDFGDPSPRPPYIDSIVKVMQIIPNPTYTYNIPSTYTVALTIRDVNGCANKFVNTIKALGPLPYFYSNPSTGCRPLPVTFTDTSVSDSALVQRTWDFGDGTPIAITSNGSIIHTYTTAGTYSVKMIVKDKNGCQNTIVKNNYIQPTFPSPAFTVDTFSCKLNVLTYNASATTMVGGTYNWNFGDGTPLFSTPNPITTHSYVIDGYYTVSLRVIDVNGCDSAITKKVRILKPTANFSWKTDTVQCGNMQVSFKDLSAGFVTNWLWDFGNGGSSTLQNPIAYYSTGGIYSVTLIVTNRGGCKDTFKLDSIITVPFAAGTYTLNPSTGCNPLTVCFNAKALNTTRYIWDFRDGTVDTTISNTACHTYTRPGTYMPFVNLLYILPTKASCTNPAINLTGPVIVTNVVSVSLSRPRVITIPKDSIVAVTAAYSGGIAPYTFSWNKDTGINCNTCSSVLLIGTGDTINYTFTIRDANGCTGTDSMLVLSQPCFEQHLIPNVFSPNGDSKNDIFYIPGICAGEKYFLQIFDRWGTLMFSTTQRHNGWDGKTNSGIDATDGIYYFVVQVETNTYKGFVHLLR